MSKGSDPNAEMASSVLRSAEFKSLLSKEATFLFKRDGQEFIADLADVLPPDANEFDPDDEAALPDIWLIFNNSVVKWSTKAKRLKSAAEVMRAVVQTLLTRPEMTVADFEVAEEVVTSCLPKELRKKAPFGLQKRPKELGSIPTQKAFVESHPTVLILDDLKIDAQNRADLYASARDAISSYQDFLIARRFEEGRERRGTAGRGSGGKRGKMRKKAREAESSSGIEDFDK